MLVNSFNLSQSFNYTHYLYYKKRFKSEINCFCIRTQLWEKINNFCVKALKQWFSPYENHCFTIKVFGLCPPLIIVYIEYQSFCLFVGIRSSKAPTPAPKASVTPPLDPVEHCKKSWRSSSIPASGDAGPIQPVSEKVSGIHEDNFTINIELFRQNVTCVKLLRYKRNAHVKLLDDNHQTYSNISTMSNFFDRDGLSQKWHCQDTFHYSTTAPQSLPYERLPSLMTPCQASTHPAGSHENASIFIQW